MNSRQIFSLTVCVSLCVVSIAVLLFTVGEPARAQVSTRYVATTGNDLAKCTNPKHPCRTVQYAVDQAAAGDVIQVAAGRYADINYRGGLPQVVYLYQSTAIRGGYTAGFEEPPDPGANATVLDAQGLGRVIYIAASSQANLTIEGLQITGGDATGLGGGPREDDTGGGVYAASTSVLISNSQVYSNTAYHGAGVAVIGAELVMRDSRISHNTGPYGGGLFLYEGSASLSGNSVLSNTSRINGGGMYILRSQVELVGNIISANSGWYGGGLFLEESSASFSGNQIHTNNADYCGLGGGIYAQECTLYLFQNVIRDNVACGGGGLYFWTNQELLDGNVILDNAASIAGGGLVLSETDTTLVNSVVAGNHSESGSGLYLKGTSLRSLHTTIAGNGTGSSAGGASGDGVGLLAASSYDRSSRVMVTNTILVSHTMGISVAAGSTACLEATLWGDGAWANAIDWAGEGAIVTGTVNVWGDPAFVDPGTGDYHIAPASSAADAGVDAGINLDIDGDTRPDNCAYDIGADELLTGEACIRIYLPLVLRTG